MTSMMLLRRPSLRVALCADMMKRQTFHHVEKRIEGEVRFDPGWRALSPPIFRFINNPPIGVSDPQIH